MRSSGGTFVTALQQVLQPVQKFTASYVDDMSVHSMAWKGHMKHLEKFLQEIETSGFTLNLKKCTFALPEVKFVGHIIRSGQRRADPSKIKTMLDMTIPTDKRQVLQVLGFFSDSISETIPLTVLILRNHSPTSREKETWAAPSPANRVGFPRSC